MRIIGNLLWWLFGGLEAAIGYFTGSLAMAITIIGVGVAFIVAYENGSAGTQAAAVDEGDDLFDE